MNSKWIETYWYQKHPLRWVLWPLALIYQGLALCRRCVAKRFQHKFDVPIIVVGNISVGGVGKTPLVIALAEELCLKGLRVGIVSRGYKAKCTQFPYEVQLTDRAQWVGDEPLLLARRTQCPVVIDPNRPRAVRYLLNQYPIDVVLSDDGLQHYWMDRALEIIVIDGVRGLGNEMVLPAGPLRESKRRLRQADIIVSNSGHFPGAYLMEMIPDRVACLKSGETVSYGYFQEPVAAVAGIGHPERFFSSLEKLNIPYQPYSFPDHYHFRPEDLCFSEKMVIMTEKDAVKCLPFALPRHFYLPVKAHLPVDFWTKFWQSLDELMNDEV